MKIESTKNARIMSGLKPSTLRTIARIARANGITPAAVLGRMMTGEHLDYFTR